MYQDFAARCAPETVMPRSEVAWPGHSNAWIQQFFQILSLERKTAPARASARLPAPGFAIF
jgi:hypothetical protein